MFFCCSHSLWTVVNCNRLFACYLSDIVIVHCGPVVNMHVNMHVHCAVVQFLTRSHISYSSRVDETL